MIKLQTLFPVFFYQTLISATFSISSSDTSFSSNFSAFKVGSNVLAASSSGVAAACSAATLSACSQATKFMDESI